MYLNFRFLDQFLCVTVQTHTHTHTPTDAHKDSDEYFIAIFCKNATIPIIKAAFDGSHLHDVKAISPVSLLKTRGISEK